MFGRLSLHMNGLVMRVGAQPQVFVIIHVVVLLLLTSQDVAGYAEGGAETSCIEGGIPHHGLSPQTSIPPYTIETDKQSIGANQSMKVTLLAELADYPFIGFQVAATWATGNKEELPGAFTDLPANSKGIPWYFEDFSRNACVTHISSLPKMKIEFTWTAPSVLKSDVIFRAGFVQEYDVFWSNVPSAKIKSNGVVEKQPYPGQLSHEFHDIDLDGTCGDSKGCFLYPDGCDDYDCDLAVSWQYDEAKEEFQFEVLGKEDAYVALGWSDDKAMGDDETVHCVADGGYSYLYYGYSPEYYNNRHQMHAISDIEIQRKDGRIQCRFRKGAKDWVKIYPVPMMRRREFDMRQPRFLQVAWGETYLGTQIPNSHVELPIVSKSKIDFTKTRVIRGRSFSRKVSLHACFGVLGYLFCASIGMMLSRHFKGEISRKLLGLPLWLQFHRAILILGVCCIIVCVVLIFVELERWTEVAEKHAILGLVSVGLMLLEVLFGFLRPNNFSKWRPLYNWAHSISAVVAYILAVICIFFGVNIKYMQWDFQKPMYIVLGVWVGLQVLFELALTLAERIHDDISNKRAARKVGKTANGSPTFDVSEPAPTKSNKGSRTKLALFFVYCILQIPLAVAALYYIFMY